MTWRCDAAGEGGTQLAEVVGVLAVGLLGPTPRRVAEGVHAHAAVEVGTDRAQLAADGLADALLEVDVPRRPAGHRDREAGRVADHDATGPVAEREPGDAEPGDPGAEEGPLVVAARGHVGHPGPERQVAVEAPGALRLRSSARRDPRGLRGGLTCSHRGERGVPFRRHGRKHARSGPDWSGDHRRARCPPGRVPARLRGRRRRGLPGAPGGRGPPRRRGDRRGPARRGGRRPRGGDARRSRPTPREPLPPRPGTRRRR